MTRSLPPRVAAFLAIVMWGMSFVATKAALREISPTTLIFTRFAMGTTLLILMVALRPQPFSVPRKSWAQLAFMGFLGVFVHQLLQALGLTLTSAINTGWLIGLTPLWSALLSTCLHKERFGSIKLLGLLGGFAGAILVIWGGNSGT